MENGNVEQIYNQDTAYVFAFAKDEYNLKYTGDIIDNGNTIDTEKVQYTQQVQWDVWYTSANSGKKDFDIKNVVLGKEAVAFKDFYDDIHDEKGNDIFQSKVKNNTKKEKVKVAVNDDGSYTVGPFNFSYPVGQYNGVNKFSWITDLYAITEKGDRVDLEILTNAGRKISKNSIGKDGANVLNGQDFYIKFTNKTAKKISLKINFKYLESCYAEMYKYKGYRCKWEWVERVEKTCTHKQHKYDEEDDGFKHTDSECPEPTDGKCAHKETKQVACNHYVFGKEYHYELVRTYLGKCQDIVHLRKRAKKNYKTAELEIKDIDLTMIISGKVFLDQDEGKVNKGNDEFNEGEELEGIEVTLYDSKNKLIGITLTNSQGYYEFKNLNAFTKYYVKFTYNGMLYTNVKYKENGDNTSKATESGQNHGDNRQNFNNVFAEIGAYPSSYKTKDCITGKEIYNKTYLQEDIVDLFKEVAKAVYKHKGNEKDAYNEIINKYKSDTDIRSKVQFVADCRISAYTVEQYPRPKPNEFVIRDSWEYMPIKDNRKNYVPIYAGEYNQRHVNLGIKARPTFDLAMYKDVLKAEVKINGKTETYNYDSRKATGGFQLGVPEQYYIFGYGKEFVGMNKAYQAVKQESDSDDWTANWENSARTQATTYTVNDKNEVTDMQISDKSNLDSENNIYEVYMRSEEIANGNIDNYKGEKDQNNKVPDETYQLQNKNELTNNRLEIFVTYKLSVTNQSSIIGAVTEIVDYYDTNYKFIRAYIGNENGVEQKGKVEVAETSIYSGTEKKSVNNKYNTIYLRPDEKRLVNNDKQWIYVVFQLVGPNGDVGTLLSGELFKKDGKLEEMNLAEINGYKTYDNAERPENLKEGEIEPTPGLIDKDSKPGNLDISGINARLTNENIIEYEGIADMYEDDTSRAPAMIYMLTESRTLEGTVFEDSTTVDENKNRNGNGTIDDKEKGINGVTVELVEIKNGQMAVRATTKTNQDGWYGFTGFVPGDYVIRYTYGSDDDTAMTTNSVHKGLNEKSYNGQDYQSTTYAYEKKEGKQVKEYAIDQELIKRHTELYKGTGETTTISKTAKIETYTSGNYWYKVNDNKSDAKDDEDRRKEVRTYSKAEYGTEITNHKAEVFNSYVNPQPSHITEEYNGALANELERRTYRYAYTPVLEIEVEYGTPNVIGTQGEKKNEYKYPITGVDFGLVERPKAELTIDQDVEYIKVTLADGQELFNVKNEGKDNIITNLLNALKSKDVENLQWLNRGNFDKYDKNELINIIMDEELINGAKLEITYRITVTNNSENDYSENKLVTTKAKRIINYVANNLNFDEAKNNGLWKVVSKDRIQTDNKSTLINNAEINGNKVVDLSTQSVIIEATEKNSLTDALNPGESRTTELKLEKVLSTESSADDLTYTNMTEIVEIDNTVGRYDHEATPGNQKLEEQPREHDTSGASKYATYDNDLQPDENYPPDGKIIITPPTGSNYIYYVIGITSAVILAVGIFIIKKFVIDRRK